MATLNIKDFPDDVLQKLRDRAKTAGMTLRGYMILLAQGKVVTVQAGGVSAPAFKNSKPEPDDFQDSVLDYSETQGGGEDLPPEVRRAQMADYERRQRARRPGVQR